jgi:hypothetical protein
MSTSRSMISAINSTSNVVYLLSSLFTASIPALFDGAFAPHGEAAPLRAGGRVARATDCIWQEMSILLVDDVLD